jgi:hypothetical protein
VSLRFSDGGSTPPASTIFPNASENFLWPRVYFFGANLFFGQPILGEDLLGLATFLETTFYCGEN